LSVEVVEVQVERTQEMVSSVKMAGRLQELVSFSEVLGLLAVKVLVVGELLVERTQEMVSPAKMAGRIQELVSSKEEGEMWAREAEEVREA
jgi:hypothetical protein